MAKTRDKPLQFHSIAEWRQASMPADVKEFLERCDIERQEDISTTIKSSVERLLTQHRSASKVTASKGE